MFVFFYDFFIFNRHRCVYIIFAETIKTNVNNAFDDYERRFGSKAVSRLASYVSVSEFGLTETELLELLMPTTGEFGAPLHLEDGNFNFSTFCMAKKTISKKHLT